ncbi:MAG TPA: NAD(P)-dependent alcohol dehydrogenase [Phenylobacterium sp.]|nr:NAD(P)-dependent alcohol dehydrogenase [Phenylobacterium sp.]
MKVLLAGPPWGIENLQYVDQPDPTPGPGQVTVRMRAASLNYRDLVGVAGAYGRQAQEAYVPFSDGCGVVEQVGEGVTRVAPGDRVSTLFFQAWLAGKGSYQARASALGPPLPGAGREIGLFSAEGVSKVPEHLTDQQVATLPCAALTAWRALFHDADLNPGDTVVLQGTGGVSIIGLQLAHAAGMRTIITSSSDEKLERARGLGANETINYRENPEWARKVMELTGGQGAEFIMEVGGAGTLEQSLRCVAAEGHIAAIGVLSGAAGPPALVGQLIGTSATIKGVSVGSREMYEAMCKFIALHRIEPVVDKVYPWTEAKAAFAAMAGGEHFGKIVLEF